MSPKKDKDAPTAEQAAAEAAAVKAMADEAEDRRGIRSNERAGGEIDDNEGRNDGADVDIDRREDTSFEPPPQPNPDLPVGKQSDEEKDLTSAGATDVVDSDTSVDATAAEGRPQRGRSREPLHSLPEDMRERVNVLRDKLEAAIDGGEPDESIWAPIPHATRVSAAKTPGSVWRGGDPGSTLEEAFRCWVTVKWFTEGGGVGVKDAETRAGAYAERMRDALTRYLGMTPQAPSRRSVDIAPDERATSDATTTARVDERGTRS